MLLIPENPRYVLGIDPGLQGGLALFDIFHPEQSVVWDMPLERRGGINPHELHRNILSAISCGMVGGIVAAVENVHSMPRQAGAFNFGLSTGIIHGILAANEIPMVLVAPSVWKVKMGLQRGADESQSGTKDRSRALASQLVPALASEFKLKKSDGKAEALLIAIYYNHIQGGGK